MRGHLNVPVIGVAKAGWNLEQFRARAQDSLEKHGGIDPAAFAKLFGLLRYVDGDYQDPATWERSSPGANRYPAAGVLSRHPAVAVRNRGRTTGDNRAVRRDARVILEKPFGHDLASAQSAQRDSARDLR